MKKFFPLYISFLLVLGVKSQITLSQNDFANAGDAVNVSIGLIDSTLNYTATGANITWNFSNLQPDSQKINSYLDVSTTSLLYAIYFANIGGNTHRANIATTGIGFGMGPVTVSNVYNFFYKTPSNYSQEGYGADVNGFPTPVGFTNMDVVYNFPIQFGNVDSSHSDYNISIPGLGSDSHEQTRTNYVDGWGTLTTPYGTFPVLKIRSEIVASDSFYIDTFHFGIRQNRPLAREYKWLGNGQQLPLLQINTTSPGGNERITSIIYRDSVRNLSTGIVPAAADGFNMNVFPDPAANSFTISCAPQISAPILTIADMSGRIVLVKPMAQNAETINAEKWRKGVYFITLNSGNQKVVRKLVLQ